MVIGGFLADALWLAPLPTIYRKGRRILRDDRAGEALRDVSEDAQFFFARPIA
jgi:hypothetical protein